MITPTLPGQVLLIEDGDDDVALMRRAVLRANLPVELEVALDGAVAIDRLTAPGSAAPPDLVLLDLKLPKFSGLEVLAAIRAAPRTALLPVVVLTTSIEPSDRREAYRLGANSYLRKPVDFNEFVELMKLVVRYWLETNQAPPRREEA